MRFWVTMGAFKLPEVQRVRFLNTGMESEFKKALETLALSHDTAKKAVSIRCVGEGKRRVQVSYVRFSVTNFLPQAEAALGTNLNDVVEANYQRLGTNLATVLSDAKSPEDAKQKIREQLLKQHAIEPAHSAREAVLPSLEAGLSWRPLVD